MGRLDIDTVGLCVLTNDGDLAHRILSPAKHVPKTYYAEVDGHLDEDAVEAFAEGMDLGDFTAKPASLKIIEPGDRAEVTIAEGKFHQVKRMFADIGKKVLHLKRVEFAGLTLDNSLEEGQWRELSGEELAFLYNIMQ